MICLKADAPTVGDQGLSETDGELCGADADEFGRQEVAQFVNEDQKAKAQHEQHKGRQATVDLSNGQGGCSHSWLKLMASEVLRD